MKPNDCVFYSFKKARCPANVWSPYPGDDCPEDCPIVKLQKEVETQQEEINKLRREIVQTKRG